MNTNSLIKAFLEAIKEKEEKELENKVDVVTKLFNSFKEEKDDNYNGFREFINSKDCLCYIKYYAEFINSLSDDEIKQVIDNTDLKEDEFLIFKNILIERIVEVKNDILDSIKKFQTRFINQINNKTKDYVNLEDMTKEELIDYIKKNK